MKQGAKYVGGLLLAAALLWIVLRGKDPTAIRAALLAASFWGLALAALLNLVHMIFRVARWRLILRPVRPRIPVRPMFSAVVIGYMTTWVIPGRLGEIVRPALLSAKEKLPLGPCLGSIVADRLLDGLAILVLFAVGTWLTPAGESSAQVAGIRTAALLLVLVLAVVIGVLIAASAAHERVHAWLDRRGPGAVGWMGRTLLSLAQGTEALRDPRLLAPLALHSLLAWITIALATWVGVRAAGAEIGFAGMLVLLPPLALGVALPTPGGAGGYHAAMSLGLMHLFGVSEGVAVSAGILVHLTATVPVIALGLVLLRLEGLSWGDLLTAARQVRGLGARPVVSDCSVEGMP